MKLKEFIISELNTIYFNLESIKIRYEYLDSIDVHFIEITPFNIHKYDGYLDIIMSFREKLYDLYPEDLICFIDEDSVNKIENPTKVWNVNDSIINQVLKKEHKFSFSIEFITSVNEIKKYDLVLAA